MNIRRLHLMKLLTSFEWKTNAFIPEIDPDEYRGRGAARLTIEDVARQVREMWMLPTGPIPNMVELLENNGGIVIPCDFGTDLIDAMSQRIDGLPVLFFVNVNAPADRLRQQLLTNLGICFCIQSRSRATTKWKMRQRLSGRLPAARI